MGKVVKTLQQSIEAINYASFALLLFLLPFPWHYVQPVMAIWLVSWTLEFRWIDKNNFRFHKSIIPLLLMVVFVIWEAISLCWVSSVSHGMDILQKHVILLAILLISLFGTNHLYNSIKLKSALYIGCLVSVLSYLTIIYWNQQAVEIYPWLVGLPNKWVLFGDYPISIIKHHLYYCIVLLAALCFSGSLYRYYKKVYSSISAFATIGIGDLILLSAILLSGCRTMILLLPIIAIIGILLHCKGWKQWVSAGIAIVCIGIATICFCSHNVRFIKTMHEINLKKDQIKDTSVAKEPRVYLWYTVINHREDYGILGLGVGSAVDQMNQYANEDNFPIAQQQNWGPHNFYLNTWMELGPLAVLFLLGILIATPLCHTKNIRKEVLFTTLIFGWAILTEEMFTQIRGLYLLSAMIVLMQLLQREDLEQNHFDNN